MNTTSLELSNYFCSGYTFQREQKLTKPKEEKKRIDHMIQEFTCMLYKITRTAIRFNQG